MEIFLLDRFNNLQFSKKKNFIDKIFIFSVSKKRGFY